MDKINCFLRRNIEEGKISNEYSTGLTFEYHDKDKMCVRYHGAEDGHYQLYAILLPRGTKFEFKDIDFCSIPNLTALFFESMDIGSLDGLKLPFRLERFCFRNELRLTNIDYLIEFARLSCMLKFVHVEDSVLLREEDLKRLCGYIQRNTKGTLQRPLLTFGLNEAEKLVQKSLRRAFFYEKEFQYKKRVCREIAIQFKHGVNSRIRSPVSRLPNELIRLVFLCLIKWP